MKTSSWFASLVPLPVLIAAPGEYITRSGEKVTVSFASLKHDFGCRGRYENGVSESWHKSGRILFTTETNNDIISPFTVGD